MRVLLLINATLDQSWEREIAAGRHPRKDYLELQRALDADVIDLAALDRWAWLRVVRRFGGAAFAQALLAWLQSPRYDAIFADRETSGFVLAALCQLLRRRPRLVLIGHLLSATKKQVLFRALHLHRALDCIIVHSSLQQRIAEHTLGLRAEQVALVPYQTDDRFWAPHELPMKNQICSVGLESRDYGTLIEAVTGIDVDVVIVAASYWSKHQAMHKEPALPTNVRVASSHVASFDYEALRQLYAESLFVVVPLHDVEGPAGITTILEAMAMGKAVVVSHTRGQTDAVRDRRQHSRFDHRRQTQPDWAHLSGTTDRAVREHTGIYVQPGNATELRRAITYLLQHPAQARAMGANGRRVVEETMSLDRFTERVAKIIAGDHATEEAVDTYATAEAT